MVSEVEKFELEETIKELESYRGRHTELITVLVPAGFSIHQVVTQLSEEIGTATNIKSNTTRKNVIASLEKAARKLKELGKTPENGIAVYSGNVSGVEGKDDFRIWAIEPPKPLKIRMYRCDQTFVVDPLKEMIVTDEVYGLIIIERKEASIGLLEGKSIRLIENLTSGVPSKVKAGGQSAQRYHRITEGLAKEFFRRVAEVVKEAFFEMKNIRGILVGGPIPTKEEFLETGQLVTELKKKVIAVKDIGDTGIAGLRMLVQACEDVLEEQEVTKQKKILDEFFAAIGKTPEKVAYGEAEVEQRLNEGSVGKLILSKTLSKEKRLKFESLAKQTSVETHIVSDESPEGVQFDNIGGVGGLLRYAVHQ